jgi:4-diphosphocytidyl-2-C-methyl-D-erythritol kinase
MCPIDRYDTLIFQEDRSGQVRLTCHGSPMAAATTGMPDERLPTGQDNLVVRAVELLRREAGVSSGAAMRLIKRIPVAAGLGGGSSDAAAALQAANVAWGLGLTSNDLTRLGARLGSDVPFFFADGPAVCRGRGERVEPIAGMAAVPLVVVRPPEGLSTAAVYRVCRPAERPKPIGPLIDALRRGDASRYAATRWNRLQPAAATLSPWIDRLADRFESLDLPAHGMSGSGTSYFGICRHQRHARRVASRILTPGIGSVLVAATRCR